MLSAPPVPRISRRVRKRPCLEPRPKMTIVAGFPLTGFVVLAADSEEGGQLEKSSVHKIAVVDKGNCKCLIGGAGHGDFIDLAVQHAEEQIPPNADLKVMRQKLESIVTDIYANRIDRYPEHERDSLSFELLCALWSRKDQDPRLVRVRRSACLIKKTPEAIGIGTYLARYIMATLGSDELQLTQAIRLATYLIAQAKKHVSYCGGSTQVVVINAEGYVVEVPAAVIAQSELMTALVVEDIAKIIFYATDPLVTGFDGDKMKDAVEQGIAAWGAQLPMKFVTMMGLPQELLATQQAASQPAAVTAPEPSSNPINSSTDQT